MKFVGIGFDVIIGVVVPGDGIEARAFGLALSHDSIGHTNNRAGVHAPTQVGEDGPIGTEFAPHRCGKHCAEVLFIFGVSAIANSLTWIEVPIFPDGLLSGLEKDK